MTYLNVTEVESGVEGLARAFPSLCEKITLPHPTFEGRTCNALRVGRKASSTTGILFIGSVHACEWGGADICVSFAADLLHAAAAGAGLSYGGKSFSAWAVSSIVDAINVFVFPCVNPDGRHFSQIQSGIWRSQSVWRKNRNPASSGGDANRIGVDVNRNYNFLWDFAATMDPTAPGASADPGDPTFHGTSPESEPETRNVVWLFETYPKIQWFMDVHCHKGDVLYSWGDDQDQTTDASMSFRNAAWNGKRGRDNDAYREFIATKDLETARAAANRFSAALTAARGTVYAVKPSFELYPTSGAGDDYAYGRHFLDAAKANVFAYTLEYGLESRPEENTFQPKWPVMEEIIREVSSGMIELCLVARPSPIFGRFRFPLPLIRLLWRRVWPWEIWGPYGRRLLGTFGLVALALGVIRRVTRRRVR
jgi:murein tripeptide amidase MpaA